MTEKNIMQLYVREFMTKMDQVVGDQPGLRDEELRIRLIWEESTEVCKAIWNGDFEEVIDGLCDLLYVTFGACEAFGIDIMPFFEEVHRTNMLKQKGIKDKWGKIIKPKGWQPPRIKEILVKEGLKHYHVDT